MGMPLQNRVDPLSKLHAHPARGALMGNRGVLHDGEKRIIRPYQGRRWISCLTRFGGRRRAVMTEGRYTELFFLDDWTALAAGHRPCALCRREDYARFADAYCAARGRPQGALAEAIDRDLHASRLLPSGARRLFQARIGDLPRGVMFRREGQIFLHEGEGARLWSFSGYGSPQVFDAGEEVEVVTPSLIVALLRGGWQPLQR